MSDIFAGRVFLAAGLLVYILKERCISTSQAKYVVPKSLLSTSSKGWHTYVQKIYTDADIRDPNILVEIESFANALEEHAKEEKISIPLGSELVLELEREGDHDYTWSYYFVDIESKSLFWLHDFDVTWWISELVGETSLSHISKLPLNDALAVYSF